MLKITREKNPILKPEPDLPWTAHCVFNPGVVYDKGKYRMVFSGNDGKGCIQLGYAESGDGVRFDVNEKPFLPPDPDENAFDHGTTEDPRVTYLEGTFYITYAAYRAFKIKSLEGIVMMSVALIVMIGYDPLGNYLTRYLGNTRLFYLQLPELARFLREDMNGTVFRALQIGVYIASLAVSWRIWLGIEDHLSEGEEAK